MKNVSAKRRRAAAAAAAVDNSKDDRISQLPEAILHHIFCFLDQRTAAITSVISKPWRYLWCTRPQIDFRDGITVVAGEKKEAFLSVLDRTLQGYHDRKLHLQELTLQLSLTDGETDSFLRKWIRILVQSMCVNQFHLYFRAINYTSILNRRKPLSLSIFRSESLQNLSLDRCVLKSIPAAPQLDLKHLRKLSLCDVEIPEEILDSILSNCRLVEYISLAGCTGFKRIELKHSSANLKEFCFHGRYRGSTSIAMGENNIPTLKSAVIQNCLLSANRNHQFYFSHLTHLTMRKVKMSSSDLFSCSLPCIEELKLHYCRIKEFNLSSPSMKRLEIFNTQSPFKVTVDAPSIVSFRYQGVLPQSVSLSAATTSWKSYIDLTFFLSEYSLCLNELIGLLKALSQSEIFVELLERTVRQLRNQLLDTSIGVSYDDLPVVVDHLIVAKPLGSTSACDFLNSLFFMLRPKFIYMSCSIKRLTKTQRVTEPGEMYRREFWQPFLEGAVTMQVFYSDRGGKWEPFEPEILSKLISKIKGQSTEQNCLLIDMERRIKLMIFN